MIATFERRLFMQYRRWALVAVWMGVIFYFSSRSTLPKPKGVSANLESIAGHLMVYAVLALLVNFALSDTGISSIRRLTYSFLFALIYGVTDEFHQSLVPGRDPALFDLAMDALGAVTALAAWQLVERRRRVGRSSV
jgi:VanZ family protein